MAPTIPAAEILRRFLLGAANRAESREVEHWLREDVSSFPVLDSLHLSDTLVESLRAAGERGVAIDPDAEALIGRIMARQGPPPPPSEPLSDDARRTSAGPVSPLLEPLPEGAEPVRLGDYRILHVLGRGGMGVVYEAEDERLRRRVALKVMRPELAAQPEARTRFLREAQAAAALDHDHVVAVYHVGEDTGRPFLAMPLLKGESLEDRVQSGPPFAITEVLRIGRQLAAGLAAAHEHGLIHRDVKPGNVWLDAHEGRVKILDFGLARPNVDEAHLTQSGAIVGTPAFMAPEQARGEVVDARADLFSLGCVLYRLLTGRQPFAGATTLAVLARLAAEKPVEPRTLNPQCPEGLSRLVMHLLEKDPADRPASARKVADALADLAATTEARHRRPPLHRWAIAASVLLALLPLGYYFGGAVLRYATNRGELVVEVDDPGIEIKVIQDGLLIHDKPTKREFTLKAGKGEIEVSEKDGVRLATKKFELTRGGKTTLRVTQEELAAARKPAVPEAHEPDPVSPLPLAEWLKGRAVLTVAQDGTGQFKTIGAAVDALKPGQVVKVLDRGPYRERITRWNNPLPADVGIVSEVGTRVVLPDWQTVVPAVPGKSGAHYHGWELYGPGGLRLHGLELVCPRTPANAGFAQALTLHGTGEIVLESCRIRQLPGYPIHPPRDDDTTWQIFAAVIVRRYGPGKSMSVVARRNDLQGSVWVLDNVAPLRIEENRILAWRWNGIQLESVRNGPVIIRGNVIRSSIGIYFRDRTGDRPSRYQITNNVIDAVAQPILVRHLDDDRDARRSFPSAVRIQNNVFRSGVKGGVHFHWPDELAALRGAWTVGHNAYAADPVATGQQALVPRGPTDRVVAEPFASADLAAPDSYRLGADSPLATVGAGGDLPRYVGVFSPGPPPRDGDWFTRLVPRPPPADLPGLLVAAREALEDGDFGEAERLAGLVERKDPKSVEPLHLRAQSRLRGEQVLQAIPDLDEVLRRDPRHAAARADRAYAYLNTGQLDRCIEDGTELLWQKPAANFAGVAHANRGGARGFKGEFREALRDFEDGVKHCPDVPFWRYWCGMLHARLGDADQAKAAFDEAYRQQPDLKKLPTDRFDHVVPQPRPLAEWLQGREVLTVSQDGKGRFKTIGAALDALKPGQVVKILDRGPYRERWDRKLPEDVGIVSDVGTVVDVHEWTIADVGNGSTEYRGHSLEATRGLRLAGLEFTCPAVPKRVRAGGRILGVRAAGVVVVEACRFRRTPHYRLEPAIYVDGCWFGAVHISYADPADRGTHVFVQECLAEGGVGFAESAGVAVTRNNHILGWEWIGVSREGCAGEFHVRHNVIHGRTPVVLQPLQPATGGRYHLCNNLFDAEDAPIAFIDRSPGPEKAQAPPRLEIRNNLLHSRFGRGIYVPAKDRPTAGTWSIDHNVYLAKLVQEPYGGIAEPWPLGPTDRIVGQPFLSSDPANADQYRIAADGPLATTGAGGLFPAYVGAFPPGPAPKGGDWFTRLPRHTAPPTADDLLAQARDALEVARHDDLQRLASAVIRLDPRRAEAFYLRAQSHARRYRLAEAIPDFDEALRLEPHHREALAYRGYAFLNTGQPERCVADCDAVLRLKPDANLTATALGNRGGARSLQGRFREALADFEAALEHNPNVGDYHGYRSVLLARLGQSQKAEAALTKGIRLDPKVKNFDTHRLDNVVAQPPPLAEWLRGREVLTVSQDGTGQYKSIGAALDALKPGQVVKILDKGPYRERLLRGLPENVGIISEAGTRIEWHDWGQGVPLSEDAKRFTYTGTNLACPRDLRLSGLDFAGGKLPADAAFSVVLVVRTGGDVVVEGCRLSLADGRPGKAEINSWGNHADNLWLRENRFERLVQMAQWGASVVVERNVFYDPQRQAVHFWTAWPPRALVVRDNVVRGTQGVVFGTDIAAAKPASWAATTVLIANNDFATESHPIALVPLEDAVKSWYPARVRIHNNIFRAQDRSGVILDVAGMNRVKDVWNVSHNCYPGEPGGAGRWVTFARHPKDRVEPSPFVSADERHPDYLRTKPGGPLATGGIGGDLPSYLGPLPPGSAPQGGDWLTRLAGAATGSD